MLDRDFLAPYRRAGDPFQSLLARATYLSKYCREGETWTDTIARCVLGSAAEDRLVSREEAEALFDAFWHGACLPSGRGLWTGGVAGIRAEARRNCWAVSLRSIEDWCWCADMLMLGGGVGVTLLGDESLPVVARGAGILRIVCRADHPDVAEVSPDAPGGPAVLVPDSREGWVYVALRRVLEAAWRGEDLTLDVSPIRERGARIRTFGGIACGPGPLVRLLREVWAVVRGAAGRRLTSVERLDVTNWIGVCVKSGNVRRSALIVLGQPGDSGFRRAKTDWEAVRSHRHTSNNSIALETREQAEGLDYVGLVEDLIHYGEPGLVNLWRCRLSDPGVRGINPCGEVPLWDREACNLVEVFPARCLAQGRAVDLVARLAARYCLRQSLAPFEDFEAEGVRARNMRLGVGLGGVCDFDVDWKEVYRWRSAVRREACDYADALEVARPIATTTVKPSGTISLLLGSSPGMHADHSPFYLRRSRIARYEPIAEALLEAGVPCEPCVYDSTGQTLVFAFPTASPARTTSKSQTLRDQFERQLALQTHWADNSVSATITFAPDERHTLADLLREFAPRLKSTSCLPSAHGYAQAPYEEISPQDFKHLHAQIRHDHPLTSVRGEGLEVDECAGGACPIR